MNAIDRFNARWMRRKFPQVSKLSDEQLVKLHRDAVKRADDIRSHSLGVGPVYTVIVVLIGGALVVGITSEALFQTVTNSIGPIAAKLPRSLYGVAVFSVFGFPFAALAIWLANRSVQRAVYELCDHLCPACGYDLTANTSGVCPECGRAVERQET